MFVFGAKKGANFVAHHLKANCAPNDIRFA
jgi:hypothetical protein